MKIKILGLASFFALALFFYSDFKNYYKYLLIYYELSPVVEELNAISDMQIGVKPPIRFDVFSESKLYFRYTELNCKVCVDDTFSIMKEKFSKEFLKNNVYLLIDYENERYLEFLKRRNNFYTNNIIKVPSDSIFEEVDRLNIPYFFSLNAEGQVDSFFIVMNELPERTSKYLNGLNLEN